MSDREKLAVVVAAAGCGSRFGSDKMSAQLGGRTVLETTVGAIRMAFPAVPIVVVVAADKVNGWRNLLESNPADPEVIGGGPRRQDSVRLGVERAADLGAELVAIHDGARPLVHPEDVGRVIDGLGEADAAILAALISDTVKKTDAGGVVVETLDRECLRLAQTPQVARITALESAWRRQDLSREWSDEAALIEADEGLVRSVSAEHPNPKITTAADLELVRMMIGEQS